MGNLGCSTVELADEKLAVAATEAEAVETNDAYLDEIKKSIDTLVYNAMHSQKKHLDKQFDEISKLTKEFFTRQEDSLQELKMAVCRQGNQAARTSQIQRLEEKHDKLVEEMVGVDSLPMSARSTKSAKSNVAQSRSSGQHKRSTPIHSSTYKTP